MMLLVTAVNLSKLQPVSDYAVRVHVNQGVIWEGHVTGHNRAEGFPALLELIAKAARKTEAAARKYGKLGKTQPTP